MGELGPITIFALDVLAFALLVAALLGPLLWKTRQRLRLRVVDEAGRPRVSLPIYGEYNVTVAALHATGEGAIPGRQLDGARKLLGVTDDEGRFARTYLLRKFYGILVGNRTVYLNEGDTSGAKEIEIVVTRVDGPLGEDWEARFRGKP